MGKEVITIERTGPYGVLVDGEWYGISQNADLTPDDFKKGGSYTVLINQAKSGKNYIQKIMDKDEEGAEEEAPRPVFKKKTFTPSAKPTGGYNDPKTAERIIRQGVYQAVAQSPAIVPFVLKKEDFVGVVSELSEEIIRHVKGEVGGDEPEDDDGQ